MYLLRKKNKNRTKNIHRKLKGIISVNNIPETNRQISSRHPINAGMLLDTVEVLLVKSQTVSELLSQKEVELQLFLGDEKKMISAREKV